VSPLTDPEVLGKPQFSSSPGVQGIISSNNFIMLSELQVSSTSPLPLLSLSSKQTSISGLGLIALSPTDSFVDEEPVKGSKNANGVEMASDVLYI